MKAFAILPILAAGLGFSALLNANPNINEVQIKSIQANGNGCPVGSTTKLLVDTDGSGSADFFQITYSAFSVTRPGIPAKNCIVEAVLGIPQGWSYSLVDVQYEGYAEIDSKHVGRIQTNYNFPFFSNTVSTSKDLVGSFAGEYSKNDSLSLLTAVWSPCGKVAPLNMNTRISLMQKPSTSGGQSFMDVERQSGLLRQIFNIRWKRCV
ncbi:MAG: DUF4360 domain-containing protein [Proteobacteria bacterium]|nr:DUF4360 domain-containing protein [Pseudomonadota bacterium]